MLTSCARLTANQFTRLASTSDITRLRLSTTTKHYCNKLAEWNDARNKSNLPQSIECNCIPQTHATHLKHVPSSQMSRHRIVFATGAKNGEEKGGMGRGGEETMSA